MNIPKLSPIELRHALRSAACCDAIITSEDWLRAFWYDENWSDGTAMAKYDNGAGDHVFVFFTQDGKALIKGFDHESEVSPYACEEYAIWPGMYDGLPSDLLDLLKDDAVEHEDVTFCFWSIDGKAWETGTALIPAGVDDGSAWLLSMVQMNAVEFIEWGKSYYEDGFDLLGVAGVIDSFNVVGK